MKPDSTLHQGTDRARRIVLFGLFGAGNIGNDATLEVTLYHLRRRCPEAEVLCICSGLPDCAKSYGVAALPLDPLAPRGRWRIRNPLLRHAYVLIASLVTEPFRTRRVFRQIEGTDQLVVVGTGVLDDFGALPWELPAWLLRWCYGARKSGASLHLLAVGAGPIKNPLNRYLMKWAVRLAQRRSFRDTLSKEYLAKIGVDTSGDEVVPDLVFSLAEQHALLERAPACPPRVIGVGMMGYFGWSDSAHIKGGQRLYREYIGKMSRFVAWLLGQGYGVRLLVGQAGSDERAARDLRAALAGERADAGIVRLISEPIRSFQDLLGEIARTDLVVATRFHNIISALVLGRPVISVGYANKFEALMEDIGLGSYCQEIEELDVDTLIRQFQELIRNYSEASGAVRRRTVEYRQALERLFDSTFGAVPRNG